MLSAPNPAALPVAHDPAPADRAGAALVTAVPAPSAPADDDLRALSSPAPSFAPATPPDPDPAPAPAVHSRPESGDLPGRTDPPASGAALDAVGAGFCLHGPGPTLLEANATARDLLRLGLGPGADAGAVDLSGAPADPLAHPTLLALRTGEPVQGIVLGVHPGTPRARWVRVDAAVVAAGPAADRRVATLLVDVTAQTERSRESAAAAERATRLMEPVADVICRLDDRGRFLDVTRSAATVLGHEPEDLFGRTLAGLAHVEGAEQLRQALTDARTGGLGHVVVRCRRRDGELHWMDIEV
ncbi:MAG TPA: PAS domain S-box protein, partial [Kineosporiaceae bacterium]|nr:PAS domain S-box protein [Kineosporiaceae bacterium]